LLKSALFRGGLTNETLETLLGGENDAAAEEASYHDYNTKRTLPQSKLIPTHPSPRYHNESVTDSDVAVMSSGSPYSGTQRRVSYAQPVSSVRNSPTNDDEYEHTERVPAHDQRTLLITNLPERTTHKDLVGIIRGGRLLDLFVRNDRTATISFIEGAADFLAYAKRTDIYLHTKRVSTDLNFWEKSGTDQAKARMPLGRSPVQCTEPCIQ
jgi:hypothetical protein